MKLTDWDIEQLDRLIHGNQNAGYLVETKKGINGRTYHCELFINEKIIVHTEKGKLLCVPNTLKLKGFID